MLEIKPIRAEPITPEAFQPYGQVIFPTPDHKSFDQRDAQLNLAQGIPRLYLMELSYRGRQFHQITRHHRCTQCLGAIAGQTWFLAVAPPGSGQEPDLGAIRVFQISGTCFIKLGVGTWHAGPYFDMLRLVFYNLELSDTNITDHETCDLHQRYGCEFEIC